MRRAWCSFGPAPAIVSFVALGLCALVWNAQSEQLVWHEARLDDQGKLLSWIKADSPYDKVIRIAWDGFKKIPVQTNGYRTYFTYPTFHGPRDQPHPLYSGRPWVHHPAGLFALLTDS